VIKHIKGRGKTYKQPKTNEKMRNLNLKRKRGFQKKKATKPWKQHFLPKKKKNEEKKEEWEANSLSKPAHRKGERAKNQKSDWVTGRPRTG